MVKCYVQRYTVSRVPHPDCNSVLQLNPGSFFFITSQSLNKGMQGPTVKTVIGPQKNIVYWVSRVGAV